MKIIIATDSFKGSLSAKRACHIIADAIAGQLPHARIIVKPMADGGEGTAEAMIDACHGQWIPKTVMGPLPNMTVEAGFAWFEDTKTALIEMACASGITLLHKEQLNPLRTTTYGTGQLIQAAIEKKPKEILLAVGGSATVDMGIGAAMAMGWDFRDKNGQSIGLGGDELEKIESIIPPDKPFNRTIKVLSDVDNPLYGPNGAAELFGPQKGADPQTVKKLDYSIKQISEIVRTQSGIDIADIPGAGAAGGLGAGAVAFMNAKIVSGIETIMEVSDLHEELQEADWIITGEGKLDRQSLQGKVVSGIIKAAQQTNTKIIVIAGDVQLNPSEYETFGIVNAIGLKKENMTTEYAMEHCESLLHKAGCEFAKNNFHDNL